MHAHLWQVLEHGCRVWLNPGPFDHSKLLVVDGAWALLGSANWDARSLRLNFEFDIECYNAELGRNSGWPFPIIDQDQNVLYRSYA
jgi:cardiolipin synthase